ncbi:aminotransferase class V-fold PLP-dependent enzyme [Salinarimonas ramus]|uniref:Aminotransferase class V domain-containing protein n=1 Tax=Salinarimonas ramus TaxID=690164 RepID=A0A917QKN7_9HYPH|nr:aminotransferase class V-fold PLP-dependent enzyme [Salinarimonas ramus]GGK55120.1 hypothetical protein GCM10011322_47300 [Salinarimonas ramus]
MAGAEAFARAVDGNTRLVTVSAVQSATGYRADFGALREIADRSDALLFGDASRIGGALPIDVTSARIDAMVALRHELLTVTRGFGYAVSTEELRAPPSVTSSCTTCWDTAHVAAQEAAAPTLGRATRTASASS